MICGNLNQAKRQLAGFGKIKNTLHSLQDNNLLRTWNYSLSNTYGVASTKSPFTKSVPTVQAVATGHTVSPFYYPGS